MMYHEGTVSKKTKIESSCGVSECYFGHGISKNLFSQVSCNVLCLIFIRLLNYEINN